MPSPDYLSRDESLALGRKRRVRNIAMLAVLVALCATFFAITVVRLGGG